MAAVSSRIYLSPPWLGGDEMPRVEAAFASGWIAPCGPAVDAFEAGLAARLNAGVSAGSHSAAAVSSGTAAMDLVMAERAVGPGCVVVASTLTFIATVGPAVHRGATPVFVDSDPATGTMSVPLLAEALEALARTTDPARITVIAADIYGQCCDYDALEAVTRRYGATLVVDAAEAVGATYRGRAAGTAGLAAVYSFNGNKLITTSGGGAVVSSDPALAERARWRAQQAREPRPWYEHAEVGYNYRLSNILAALGCAQLGVMDEIIRRKRARFARYAAALKGRAVPFPCAAETESTRWLSVFLFPDAAARDAVSARLAADNIECRPVWKPMHLQPVFRAARVFGGAVAADLFQRGLCLPSGAGLTEGECERIEACL